MASEPAPGPRLVAVCFEVVAFGLRTQVCVQCQAGPQGSDGGPGQFLSASVPLGKPDEGALVPWAQPGPPGALSQAQGCCEVKGWSPERIMPGLAHHALWPDRQLAALRLVLVSRSV